MEEEFHNKSACLDMCVERVMDVLKTTVHHKKTQTDQYLTTSPYCHTHVTYCPLICFDLIPTIKNLSMKDWPTHYLTKQKVCAQTKMDLIMN